MFPLNLYRSLAKITTSALRDSYYYSYIYFFLTIRYRQMSLLLGIDLGTSFIKVSVLDAATGACLAGTHYPQAEAPIESLKMGWAEQSPESWWENTKAAIWKLNASGKYDPRDISAIGIAYQMHGLVLVDKEQQALRKSIIWCDSRAVEIGETAFKEMGAATCLDTLLNSPGNFTASKLA